MMVHFSSIQYILIIFFPLPKLLSDPYSTPRAKFYVHPLTLRREKKEKSQGNKTNKQTKTRQKSQNITKHTYRNHSINHLLLGMVPTLESGCKRQEVFSGANWVSLHQLVSVESNFSVRMGLCVYFPFPMLGFCLICTWAGLIMPYMCTVFLGL